MKEGYLKLVFVFGGIISLALIGAGIYMAINNKDNWGWLIFAGIVVLGGCIASTGEGLEAEENEEN